MENKLTIKDSGIKWGLILGLVLIVYSLILLMLGVAENRGIGMISYLFVAGGFYMAFKEFKEANGGFMSFNEGFKIGAIATAIYSLFSSVFLYVYLIMIDDSMIGNIIDNQYDELEAQGMSDEEIDVAMGYAEPFMTPEMITIFGFFGTLFFGIILCLVMAAIFKKKNPELE